MNDFPRGAHLQPVPLFETPFAVYNMGEQSRELNKLLVVDSFKEKEKDSKSRARTGIDVWQAMTGLQEKYPSFKQLAQIIENIAFEAMKWSGYKRFPLELRSHFKVDSIWVNMAEDPSAFHLPHIHGDGNTCWTGVYYPTTGIQDGEPIFEEDLDNPLTENLRPSSEPSPGDLILYDPAATIKRQTTPSWAERYPFYGCEMCFSPREGALLVFPSWVEHSTAPHKKANFTRVSISFSVTRIR